MNRPCLTCGRPGPTSRCPTCQTEHRRTQERNRARATTAERGYGAAHQRARAAMLKRLPLFCEKCGLLLETPADLVCAHVIDGDPTAGWYPACRPCNEADKTRPARSATCAPDLWPAETAEFFHRDTRP